MSSRVLEGYWALVTGASRGIGRAIALALARQGCAVALASRSEKHLTAVAKACAQVGATGTAIYPVDLSYPRAVNDLADDVLVQHGAVDILVNNAGVLEGGDALDGDPDAWERMMATNLGAPMRLTRHLVPQMVDRRRGTIINIGGVFVSQQLRNSGAYVASKEGLRGWSTSCHQRLREYGIKVVLIRPAIVRTEMVAKRTDVRFENLMTTNDVAQAAMLAVLTSPMCCPSEIDLDLTKQAVEL